MCHRRLTRRYAAACVPWRDWLIGCRNYWRESVDDAYANAVEHEQQARKAIAHSMYWTFLALLIGAFCASISATIGGRDGIMFPLFSDYIHETEGDSCGPSCC